MTTLLALLLLGCTDKGGPGTDGAVDSGDGTSDTDTDGGSDSGPTGDGGGESLVATLTLYEDTVDECGGVCGSVDISGAGEPGPGGLRFTIESDLDGFVFVDGAVDGSGNGDFCIEGPLTPGTHQLAAIAEGDPASADIESLDVRPFGWSYGLDKPSEPLAAPWFVPSFTTEELTASPPVPYSATTEIGWDTVSALAPTVVLFEGRRYVYFSGTPDTTFALGIAYAEDEGLDDFVKYENNPILTVDQTGAVEGDWDFYAQNTPEALVRDGQVWLYYNGRSEETSGLNIGLAKSDDGLHFTRIDDNPVLAPTGDDDDFDGNGIAHPSVHVRAVDFADNDRGASEVFEMWYASGTLEIGYALSTDGVDFERYCGGAVFSGKPGTWDAGETKAPEVIVDDEGRYHMTYSGCGQGCYEVGWAQSEDGIRWAAAERPIIPTQEAPSWNSYGTQEAFIEVDGPVWRLWYAGTGDNHGSIGFVEYTPE